MEPQGAHKDHEEQQKGDERWHHMSFPVVFQTSFLLTLSAIGREEERLHRMQEALS